MPYVFTPEKRSQIINALRQEAEEKDGLTLAWELGISLTTVFNYGKQMGINIRVSNAEGRAKRVQMRERIQWIRDNGADKTLTEIAAILKVSYGSVYSTCHYYGLPFKEDTEKDPAGPKSVRHIGGVFNVHARENWMI